MNNSCRRPLSDSSVTNSASTSYGWSSENWSGYAVSSQSQGTYKSISATWTVPQVSAPNTPNPDPNFCTWLTDLLDDENPASNSSAYSASWIGIDGFTNSHLIQAGTAQNIIHGHPQYFAWWEVLPNSETPLDPSHYPVFPGDQIKGNISRQSDGTWSIQLTNTTQNWTFTENDIAYIGPQTSAEWIEEAPTLNGTITTLADYGEVTFRAAQINGQNQNLTLSEAGVMVQNGQWISTPSKPNANGDSFSIAYGSTPPTSN